MQNKTRQQVVIIHGGETFDSYEEYIASLKEEEVDFDGLEVKKWKETFGERLGPDFQVILPEMPSPRNAKYLEWKIWFDKFVPHFAESVILMGNSLGGIFLAKYLAENRMPQKIKALFLIAAPYDTADSDYSLADFVLPKSLAKIGEQCSQVFIYHSKDDPVVPFGDSLDYKSALPSAKTAVFEDKNHFSLVEFPELVKAVREVSVSAVTAAVS